MSAATQGAPLAGTNDVPLLEARGVTVRFGKVTALDGLDLTLTGEHADTPVAVGHHRNGSSQ